MAIRNQRIYSEDSKLRNSESEDSKDSRRDSLRINFTIMIRFRRLAEMKTNVIQFARGVWMLNYEKQNLESTV